MFKSTVLEPLDTNEQGNMSDRMDLDEDLSVMTQQSGIHLPDEIVIQILSYIPREPYAVAKRTFFSACQLSHQWYDAAIPLLYERPVLGGRNFLPFVRTICPSKNAHVIRSPLAELVKVLDLRHLVHEGSKSTTARLIGRTKGQLEEFMAPVATFSAHCFPALSKCTHLKLLDLSLVAESPPLPDLFRTVAHLEELQTLRLPRSSGFGVHHRPSAFSWPPNLRELCLSGCIDAHFLHGIVAFPPTLRHLTIENCPNAKTHAVTHLLMKVVRPLPQLESLKIANMPRISRFALDGVLCYVPQLKNLSVSIDYVSAELFDAQGIRHHHLMLADESLSEEVINSNVVGPELRSLEFTVSNSSHTVDDKLTPIDVVLAMSDGSLPKLRQLRIARELQWDQGAMREDLESLVDELQSAAHSDWVKGEWVFEGRPKSGHEHMQPWKDVSGVWTFPNDGR